MLIGKFNFFFIFLFFSIVILFLVFFILFFTHTQSTDRFSKLKLFFLFLVEKNRDLFCKKYIQNCTCQSIDGFFNFPIKKTFNYFFDFFPIEYWVFHTEIIKIILIYMEKTVSWWSRLKNGVKRKTHEKHGKSQQQ